MRVNCTFHDKAYGDFIIDAEVSGSGRVQVITVEDEHGTDVDFDDFSPVEKEVILSLAKATAIDIDNGRYYNEDEDEDD